MSQPQPDALFSVSKLNQTVKDMLEGSLYGIWLMAEISNFSQPASGHWYFTLKDERAQVRAAMFRGNNRSVTFRPKEGDKVLVRANVTLYEPRGDYQLLVELMQPSGEGLLKQQFEQLKQTLTQEGLFSLAHKKALPHSPKRLGIITSPSGAALYDMLNVLKRRQPALPIVIYPSMVQGQEAPAQLIRMIQLANLRKECDVLVLARGGGSLEDLWCFNNEQLARAIFASDIPIVSAVGHETDVTIADFVADLRAPTPSAAAELVSQDQHAQKVQLHQIQQRVEMAFDYALQRYQQRHQHLLHRLSQQHPNLRLIKQKHALHVLQSRIQNAVEAKLRERNQLVQRFTQTLFNNVPYQAQQRRHQLLSNRLMRTPILSEIHQQTSKLAHSRYQLESVMRQLINGKSQQFGVICSQLETMSPLKTLQRGYSLAHDNKKQVIRSKKQVKVGDTLTTRLNDGEVKSQIIQID